MEWRHLELIYGTTLVIFFSGLMPLIPGCLQFLEIWNFIDVLAKFS